MTTLKGIKGFRVKTLSTDTVASGISGATWSSGGNIPQALYENAGAGATQTAALNFGGQGATAGAAVAFGGNTASSDPAGVVTTEEFTAADFEIKTMTTS